MTTAIVQIGNSDNKLSQQQWAKYCNRIQDIIERFVSEEGQIHFTGYSLPNSQYQNACLVFESNRISANNDEYFHLLERLKNAAHDYQQESIALTIGSTTFLMAEKAWGHSNKCIE